MICHSLRLRNLCANVEFMISLLFGRLSSFFSLAILNPDKGNLVYNAKQ